jgi:hypothetical protein
MPRPVKKRPPSHGELRPKKKVKKVPKGKKESDALNKELKESWERHRLHQAAKGKKARKL